MNTSDYFYQAFGLLIESDCPLPELIESDRSKDKIDITIKLEDLKDQWRHRSKDCKEFFASKSKIMFQINGLCIFSIEGGRKILYSPFDGADLDQIRLYILGTCMGAILNQRKILPLHGSAIAINGKAYAFVGESGAGKSTLARAFLRKNYQLLSDDVIAVTLSSNDTPVVHPAYPQQKLWDNSLDKFGMNTSDYRPLFERDKKFAVPVPSQFFNGQLPLAGIFELTINKITEPKIELIENMERFHILYTHTYRNFFIEPLGLREWHFNLSSKIIEKIDTYRLQRPNTKFTAEELTGMVLNSVNREEYSYER